MLLVDLRDREYTGKEAEEVLGKAAIHVNKNTIPGESRSPFVTSGLRIGTPALTTRGMGVEEMRLVGRLIDEVLTSPEASTIDQVRRSVHELSSAFPLYQSATSTA